MNKSIFNFKVLLMDDTSQNIIAPVAKLGVLRQHNITLHLNIQQGKRESVPEVAAIYFVVPSVEVFKQISKDSE